MDTIKKEYGNLLEGMMIEDDVQTLKECPKCSDGITQEWAFLVSTKFVEGKRKQFCTWSCFSCRTELISYRTK